MELLALLAPATANRSLGQIQPGPGLRFAHRISQVFTPGLFSGVSVPYLAFHQETLTTPSNHTTCNESKAFQRASNGPASAAFAPGLNEGPQDSFQPPGPFGVHTRDMSCVTQVTQHRIWEEPCWAPLQLWDSLHLCRPATGYGTGHGTLCLKHASHAHSLEPSGTYSVLCCHMRSFN